MEIRNKQLPLLDSTTQTKSQLSIIPPNDLENPAPRALHIELQLCKKQVHDTQILKKRAMNDKCVSCFTS